MQTVKKLSLVSQFNADRGQKTLHPLVTVLDQSKSSVVQEGRVFSELFIVFLKTGKGGELKYGRNHYDYDDGTMLFIAPGQVFGHDGDGKVLQPSGWALAFHPDLLRGSPLAKKIKEFNFFSYEVNEALHLADREQAVIIENFQKIQFELEHPVDKHSKELIVSNIELLLKYCTRFYDRQFITRQDIHKDSLAVFEQILDEYFQSDKPVTTGIPTVASCAGKLNLSPNYFGDLVKKETGKSALEYIQDKLIALAKEKLFDSDKSVSEVAYELGFKYPTHFTRLFKQKVGTTPVEYRALN